MKNNKKLTQHQEDLLFINYLKKGKPLKHYASRFGISIHTTSNVIDRGFKKRAAAKNATAQNKN